MIIEITCKEIYFIELLRELSKAQRDEVLRKALLNALDLSIENSTCKECKDVK